MLFINKRGAMFGLDARIALAIFGALSVISGAALYSAIQQSKVISMVSNMNEVIKAVEQYVLDQGSDIPGTGTGSYLKIEYLLVDSGVKGWDGPYMPWNTESMKAAAKSIYTYNKVDLPEVSSYYSLNKLRSDNWGGDETCVTGSPCYYFVRAGGVPNSLAFAVDLYIDGVSDNNLGRVKLTDNVAGYKNVYLQGPLMLSQL